MMARYNTLRRNSRCPAADFWHRLRVGAAVTMLILLISIV